MRIDSAGDTTAPSGQSAFGWVTSVMNGVGTLWILALMILINADIIGRAGFNRPLQGTAEIVAMSIVGIVLLQLPHTLRSGRFLRSDLLFELFRNWRPRIAALVEALFNLIGAMILGFIFYFAFGHFREAWEIGLYTGTFGQFMFPLWPVRLIVLAGLFLTTIQFLLLALASLRDALESEAPRGFDD